MVQTRYKRGTNAVQTRHGTFYCIPPVHAAWYKQHAGLRDLWWTRVPDSSDMLRVGQNYTFTGLYSVHKVFVTGKSPYIRSYTVCIHGSGQP